MYTQGEQKVKMKTAGFLGMGGRRGALNKPNFFYISQNFHVNFHKYTKTGYYIQ